MKRISFCLISCFFLTNSIAQLRIVPIPGKSDPSIINSNYRITAEKLTLPVWEDFSRSPGQPDTSLWINSQNVWINGGLGVNSPSMNVATFDGLDRDGEPYSLDPADIGFTDSLVSKPIDLALVSAAKRSSVYLSFYFQRGGLGEPPDTDDMIELQFKTAMENWIRVWPTDINDLNTLTSIFTGVSIPVADSLFYDNFQFKFVSTGRRSGSFDTWNLDYIYLDKNRSVNDFEILDRAIMSYPNSIFKNYSAIPLRQLFAKDQQVMDSTQIRIFNYETSEPVQGIEYTVVLSNLKTGNEIQKLIDRQALIIQANNFLDLKAPKPDIDLIRSQASGPEDSLFLQLQYFVDTGDTLLIDEIDPSTMDTTYISEIDLRVNDTINRNFTLHNYFAYDDGGAEFGAGVNQSGGQLVYKFAIDQPDTLIGISMHFPNIGSNIAGLPIDVIVLSGLDGFQNSELVRQTFTIQPSGIDELKFYELANALPVADTIYIGFRQSTNEFVPVGLDKNTNSGDKIYFNVDGSWLQNTEVEGSLLMRPVFGRGEVITSINEDELHKVMLYPNPASQTFFVTGDPESVRVFDLNGRKMNIRIENRNNKFEVHSVGFLPGIYLVEIMTNTQVIVQKLIYK